MVLWIQSYERIYFEEYGLSLLCPQQPHFLSPLYFPEKLGWIQGTSLLSGLEK